MGMLEFDSWTIYDHDEDAFARWAIYYTIDPNPMESMNKTIIDNIEKTIKCLDNVFQPSGLLIIAYRHLINNKKNDSNIYMNDFITKQQTIILKDDWGVKEINLEITKCLSDDGGLDTNYIYEIELCEKLKVKENQNKKMKGYPKIIHDKNDAPVILRIETEREGDRNFGTPNIVVTTINIWTNLFLQKNKTIIGEKDNSKLSRLNLPRLSEALERTEKTLNGQIKWWTGWHQDKIEKYGFKKA